MRNVRRILAGALICLASVSGRAQNTDVDFDQGVVPSAILNSKKYAHRYKLSMKIGVESKEVYHAQCDGLCGYKQVSGRKEIVTKMKGDGILSSINQTEKDLDTQVAGIDYKGHSLLILEKDEKANIIVEVDRLLDDVIDGVPVKLEKKFKAGAEFVKGSWQDYLAGKQVELRLTEEGIQIAMETTAVSMKQALRQIRDTLENQLKPVEARFGEIQVEKMEARRFSIKGSKNRFEVIQSGIEIEISFTVETDL